MSLPQFCIKRPAFTIVISLVMVIIGLIGFVNLPVRWIPNISPPVVNIRTVYPGANAQLVEKEITKPIEEALSGISGIESLSSESSQNMSNVSIEFKLGRNMDTAVEDVRSGIETVRDELPKDAKDPIVMKANPNNRPLMFLTFMDSHKSKRELSDFIERYIVPAFDTLEGVGSVEVFGLRSSALRISVDPLKMAGAQLTVDEVTSILAEQSASIPSGQIRTLDRTYSVNTDTSLNEAKKFNELILRDTGKQITRLQDIGYATIAPKNAYSTFRINGKPAIALGIIPQSTANPLEVETAVQKAFAQIKRSLPQSMQAQVVYNETDYIRASIKSVYESFIEAIIFVWLVSFVFLCSLRATLIPIITIPVCLVSSFALIYFMEFTINTLTLMALVLSIGLVVDDAIVMLENVTRHKELGLSIYQAALVGSREMIFPVIAMTLTLATVYTPVAFTSGLLGVLFKEFTVTLAGAVIISGVVALTLSPMMCAFILKDKKATWINRYQVWFETQTKKIQNLYQHFLHKILKKRLWVLGIMVLIIGIGTAIFWFLPSELAPAEDMGEAYVSVTAPRNASFQYTDGYLQQIENILKNNPNIETYLSHISPYSAAHAFQILTLKPKNERSLSTNTVIEELRKDLAKVSGVRADAFAPSSSLAQVVSSNDSSNNLGLILMTSKDYLELQQVAQMLLDKIKPMPQFILAENSLKWDNEELKISINRDKAADLKIPIGNITNTLSTLLAGKKIGKLDDIDIIVQLSDRNLANVNLFQDLYTKNINGYMIPLSQLLTIQPQSSPESYTRYGRLRADTIYLTLAPKYKMADAIAALEKIAAENLPNDIKYTFSGEAKSFLEAKGKTIFTFGLALIFIYLVLVAQFESFTDPLIIMLTVPFAVVGALLTLKLFGGSFNIYSNIGLITLIGLIAKHGILITDFANRLRQTGKSINNAVIEAAKLRLRPILMTTSAMVLGALPLALAMGPGAESRQQIGLVIMGGLIFGTFFSLIVIPVTYTFLAPLRKIALNLEKGD